MSSETDWHLYLIRTGDGSLYAGVSTDVERRLGEHRGEATRSARYLRGRGPLRVVYSRRIGDRGLALRAERRVKRLTKDRKEELVRSAPEKKELLELLNLEPR